MNGKKVIALVEGRICLGHPLATAAVRIFYLTGTERTARRFQKRFVFFPPRLHRKGVVPYNSAVIAFGR